MKLFNKFKQLSRDIKLIIITALIASCVGVYAAGECIISATAGDVTYGNSTVQSAIDELYDMSQNHCPDGYECKLTLYGIMAKNSVLDDRASTYVTNSSGIDFSQRSSDTNGKGIYEIANTQNDPYPIYYYRGAVTNNNVLFAGFCWKAIRTTDTGGVKIIYNGEPDGNGNCIISTEESSQIGTYAFNSNYNSPADVGYMYGTRYTISYRSSLSSYVYGRNVTYSGGTYTLTNTMTSTGTWSTDYNTLNNNHYTCFSTGTTCTSVYYIYYTDTAGPYYITLTNGKKVEDAIDEMFNGSNVNANNSTAKTTIDNWYNTNLSSYTSYIEDTVYCNDRSIGELNGWNPNGGDTTKALYFNPYTRMMTNHTPSLICSRSQDKFTVSSSKGNGALTYPIGLITSDEVMYAGGELGLELINTTFYLFNDQQYWSFSPYSVNNNGILYIIRTYRMGGFCNGCVYQTSGLRPVVSLNSSTSIVSGDGTSTNPYVIQTS